MTAWVSILRWCGSDETVRFGRLSTVYLRHQTLRPGNWRQCPPKLERTKGLAPSTSTLARWCSTIELRSQKLSWPVAVLPLARFQQRTNAYISSFDEPASLHGGLRSHIARPGAPYGDKFFQTKTPANLSAGVFKICVCALNPCPTSWLFRMAHYGT